MYTDFYVRLNLADNSGHWESSGTWYDENGTVVSSNDAFVVNTAFIDRRPAVAIDWLYWWDASDPIAAGSSYDSVALADQSPYC